MGLAEHGHVHAVSPNALVFVKDDILIRRFLCDTGASYSNYPHRSTTAPTQGCIPRTRRPGDTVLGWTGADSSAGRHNFLVDIPADWCPDSLPRDGFLQAPPAVIGPCCWLPGQLQDHEGFPFLPGPARKGVEEWSVHRPCQGGLTQQAAPRGFPAGAQRVRRLARVKAWRGTSPTDKQAADSISQTLQCAAHVYVRRGYNGTPITPLYSYPYKVLRYGPRSVDVAAGPRIDMVSIDHIKRDQGEGEVWAARLSACGHPPASTSSSTTDEWPQQLGGPLRRLTEADENTYVKFVYVLKKSTQCLYIEAPKYSQPTTVTQNCKCWH